MTSKSLDVLMAEFEHIKTDVKEVKDTLKAFIDKADEKYASKEEHKMNLDKINRIENAIIVLLMVIG